MATKRKTPVTPKTQAALPVDLVGQLATMNGAKQGKDAVPAGRDWAKAIAELAEMEIGLIRKTVEIQGTRADGYRRLADIMQTMDDETRKATGKQYKELVKMGALVLCFEQMGEKYEAKYATMPIKALPTVISMTWKKRFQSRLSETNSVVDSLLSHFTEAHKVLSGRGTVTQKLVALPKAHPNRGRKQGTANTEKGDLQGPANVNAGKVEASTRQTEATVKAVMANAASAVLSHLGNVNADGIIQILAGAVHAGKGRKEYGKPEFKGLIDAVSKALDKYDAATSTPEAKIEQAA